MEKEGVGENEKQPVCGEQALDLLNCVTQSPYDQDKCLRLLQSLRDCVLNKVPLSLSLTRSLLLMNMWAQFKL